MNAKELDALIRDLRSDNTTTDACLQAARLLEKASSWGAWVWAGEAPAEDTWFGGHEAEAYVVGVPGAEFRFPMAHWRYFPDPEFPEYIVVSNLTHTHVFDYHEIEYAYAENGRRGLRS